MIYLVNIETVFTMRSNALAKLYAYRSSCTLGPAYMHIVVIVYIKSFTMVISYFLSPIVHEFLA